MPKDASGVNQDLVEQVGVQLVGTPGEPLQVGERSLRWALIWWWCGGVRGGLRRPMAHA